jgi:hypothetical protein
MNDVRGRTEAGPLALARRLLGRVLDTVRGSEPPPELVPSDSHEPRVGSAPPAFARRSEPRPRDLEAARASEAPNDELREDRVVELPPEARLPAADEPARALLSDASWSGLRFEARERGALVAWRDVDRTADVLRTIEIRCDYGALDAAPEITIRDRPVSATLGATSVASDAHRLLVALGTLREGSFVSVAHATVR